MEQAVDREKLLTQFETQNKLGFLNRGLLDQALTHSSFARQPRTRVQDNEKLEFFGDAVLKLLVSEHLYFKFPKANEGQLTKIRATLVSDRYLAQLATVLGLGQYLQLSWGERNSGGESRISNLANAFEAVLGAIYLDQGLDVVRDFLIPLLEQYPLESSLTFRPSDAKTDLQEWLQRRKLPLPVYEIIGVEGPDHLKQFLIRAEIQLDGGTRRFFEGRGSTKKEAEQQAAYMALKTFKDAHKKESI